MVALKCISRSALKSLKRSLDLNGNMDQSKLSVPPRLIVDSFSFEEVHFPLALNNGQVHGCFDEVSSFYGHLDLFKLWA